MDCSLPGSSVHGIFQSRVLEWGAIAFFTGEKKKHNKLCQIKYLTVRLVKAMVFSVVVYGCESWTVKKPEG